MPSYMKTNIICILFLVFTVPASSELYQYKDENGIMRLTDTIYSVPTDSRSQLEQFSEFEGLSDELVILPIQIKPLPQAENLTENQTETQTNTEKVLYPKTEKEISVKAEAPKGNHPQTTVKKTALESKQKATDAFQARYSKKPIQEPDTIESPREPYKSKKITIDRIYKKEISQKTAQAMPQKEIKEKTEPITTPKTIIASNIVKKEQAEKITQPKVSPEPDSITQKTVQPKIVTAAKTKKTKPQKDIKKTAKPEVRKETVPEIKKEIARIPEKQDQLKTVQTPDTSAIAKKEIEIKKIIDKKATALEKIQKRLSEKIITKKAQADAKNKKISETGTKPEIKIAKKNQTEELPTQKPTPKPDWNPSKTVQPKIGTTENNIISAIKKSSTKNIISGKKADPGTDIANKVNSDKLDETKKAGHYTRKISPKVPDLIKDSDKIKFTKKTVTTNRAIKTDSSKINQKDESIILAKLESNRKLLSNKKKALNKKFMSLMKEKQEIENSVDEDDEKSVQKYNENVKKLNLKIKLYKKEKKFLQAEIERYNDAIKQSAFN